MATTTITCFERTPFRNALPGRRDDVLRQLIGARLVLKKRPCLSKKVENRDSALDRRQFRFVADVA